MSVLFTGPHQHKYLLTGSCTFASGCIIGIACTTCCEDDVTNKITNRKVGLPVSNCTFADQQAASFTKTNNKTPLSLIVNMCFSKLCWLSPQYYSAISASSFHTLLETIHGANMNGINQEGYVVDLKPPYDQASADWCHNKTHCTLLNCHLAGLTICLNMQPPPKWLSNWSLVGNGENLDWLGFGTAKNHNRNPFVIGGTYHTCQFSWTARPRVEDVLLPSLG